MGGRSVEENLEKLPRRHLAWCQVMVNDAGLLSGVSSGCPASMDRKQRSMTITVGKTNVNPSTMTLRAEMVTAV